MNRQHPRFYATLAARLVGFGAIGGLLGRALRGHPVLVAVALGLVVVGGALVWRKWQGRMEFMRAQVWWTDRQARSLREIEDGCKL